MSHEPSKNKYRFIDKLIDYSLQNLRVAQTLCAIRNPCNLETSWYLDFVHIYFLCSFQVFFYARPGQQVVAGPDQWLVGLERVNGRRALPRATFALAPQQKKSSRPSVSIGNSRNC